MSHSITITSHEYKGRFFNIEAEYEVEWSNDGIGSYEYWGAKCYDAGNDYAEVTDIYINDCHEILENGEEVEVTDAELLKALADSISEECNKDSENLEPDNDGPYDTEAERDDYDCD